METWLSIPNNEWYEISNLGRVRSVDRIVWRKDGKKQTFKGKLLTPAADNNGYPCVNISNHSGRRSFRVHELVLLVFVGPRPEGAHGCHFDGNPANNNLSNLRWDTPRGNWQDTVRHGKSKKGESHHNSKLTADQVKAIYSRCEAGERHWVVAKDFGVTRRHVGNIHQGKMWRHVTGGGANA